MKGKAGIFFNFFVRFCKEGKKEERNRKESKFYLGIYIHIFMHVTATKTIYHMYLHHTYQKAF